MANVGFQNGAYFFNGPFNFGDALNKIAEHEAAEISEALDKIEKDTRAENEYKKNNYEEYGMEFYDIELEVRRTVGYIADAMGFAHDQKLDKIARYMRKNYVSEKDAKLMLDRSIAIQSIGNKKEVFYDEYITMFNAFKVGKWYSHDKIREVFKTLGPVNLLCGWDNSNEKHEMVINRLFETKAMNKRRNGKEQSGLLIVKLVELPTLD